MPVPGRLQWRTSSRSSNGENCVEVAPSQSQVSLRHSKHRAAGTITFPALAWSAFLHETSADLPSANGIVAVRKAGKHAVVRSLTGGVELRFDEGEWTAFVAGARRGEFDFFVEYTPACH
ncbi:DUF397 domain-containing protein [Amycolatopsis nigrescens]|uniref:DUF397 domain-containing protein n=1 Tax=Amycolatopsis nigrescens TaxID=381445 RepID=UPI000381B7C9|nr:DUF397 domain-containing protein [Amycolatopsis nigrescens]